MLIPLRGWFWLVDPVWQRSLLRINSVISFGGSCDLKNIYLLRGFGIFSHQTAVIIANNQRRKARRAYIIIANIKIGICKLRRSDINYNPSGFYFLSLVFP